MWRPPGLVNIPKNEKKSRREDVRGPSIPIADSRKDIPKGREIFV